MGGDGGSIPKRVDLVPAMKKKAIAAKTVMATSRWSSCALSSVSFTRSDKIVACELGNLFIKEKLIGYLLAKSPIPEFAHISKLKDVIECRFSYLSERSSHSSASSVPKMEKEPSSSYSSDCIFLCPITGLQPNDKHKFVVVRSCGCVLSERAVREVPSVSCLVCGSPLTPNASACFASVSSFSGSAAAASSGGPYSSAFPVGTEPFVFLNMTEEEKEARRALLLPKLAAEHAKKRKRAEEEPAAASAASPSYPVEFSASASASASNESFSSLNSHPFSSDSSASHSSSSFADSSDLSSHSSCFSFSSVSSSSSQPGSAPLSKRHRPSDSQVQIPMISVPLDSVNGEIEKKRKASAAYNSLFVGDPKKARNVCSTII